LWLFRLLPTTIYSGGIEELQGCKVKELLRRIWGGSIVDRIGSDRYLFDCRHQLAISYNHLLPIDI